MKMREDEDIAKYVERIKASVNAIKAFGGDIEEKIVVSKVLITLLPIYAIRVSTIQEMRCDPNNKISLDALVGRLTTFELDNFDNYVPSSKVIESAFEAKLSLKKKSEKSKSSQSGSEEEESEESSNSDLEVVEALLARKYSKDRGKYKGKVPLIFFSVKKLVTLLQGVQIEKTKMKRKTISTKVRMISRTTRNSRTKVRNLILWLKIMIIVKMKWYILL